MVEGSSNFMASSGCGGAKFGTIAPAGAIVGLLKGKIGSFSLKEQIL
jgi:hypothetical protein